MSENQTKLTYKDFQVEQMAKWCAGCGDHFVLNAMQKALAELDVKHEDFVFISGIGCSSRFPYYMNTYGFHGIHGRAAAVSSGVKIANPELSVWNITGDGDALAIGGNHFIHCVRRNIDINIILFNNEIYGLTKGQYSPTSKVGAFSKTSPFGTVERPFVPGALTIGARGAFFARTIDNNPKLSTQIFIEAGKYKGTSVIEILQNCIIYNDMTHGAIVDKEFKDERQLILKHDEPMIFGKNRDKGLILDNMKLKVVKIGENGVSEKDILIHDAQTESTGIHTMLVNMELPEYPVAIGVIRAVKKETYEGALVDQIKHIQSNSDIKCMDDLLKSGKTWKVE